MRIILNERPRFPILHWIITSALGLYAVAMIAGGTFHDFKEMFNLTW